MDAAGPGVAGVLVVVALMVAGLLWSWAGLLVLAAVLLVPLYCMTLVETVRSRRWRRREALGCCASCGADLRHEPWKSEGVYNLLRCPVCFALFRMQQVRFPRPAAPTPSRKSDQTVPP